jgi:hypothetical protein
VWCGVCPSCALPGLCNMQVNSKQHKHTVACIGAWCAQGGPDQTCTLFVCYDRSSCCLQRPGSTCSQGSLFIGPAPYHPIQLPVDWTISAASVEAQGHVPPQATRCGHTSQLRLLQPSPPLAAAQR